jgi:adenosine deaminase
MSTSSSPSTLSSFVAFAASAVLAAQFQRIRRKSGSSEWGASSEFSDRAAPATDWSSDDDGGSGDDLTATARATSIATTVTPPPAAAAAASDGISKSVRLVRYLSDQGSGAWKSYTDDDELFVQEFPKVELHVHLDGSVDPDFLWRYMQDHSDEVASCLPVSVDLPWEPGQALAVKSLVQGCATASDFHRLCTCRGYQSLKAMLNCFEIFLPILRRNLDLLEQIGYDFVQRQWEQNVMYTEVRYSPFLLAEEFNAAQPSNNDANSADHPVVSAEDVFRAVTRGLRRGCAKFHVTVNQIVCAITWRPDWADPSLDMAYKHKDSHPCAVVGIDIAAGEEHFDSERFPNLHQPHYRMIQRAQQLGVPITMHAGESTDLAARNVEQSIVAYGATRIGHGYRMVQDPNLVRLVRERNVHVEVCPTSSYETGGWVTSDKDWSGHPVVAMNDAGISYSLSSDDPAVFHTSLAWQYRIALAKMNLTRKDLVAANLSAIDAAFCSPTEKARLRETLLAFAAAQRVEAAPSATAIPMHASKSDSALPAKRDALASQMISKRSESNRTAWKRSHSDNFVDRVYISASFKM